MTIKVWLEMPIQDAERRGLPALRPLLEALARATSALRAADWNGDATGEVRARREYRMPAEPRTIAELARALRAREVTAEAVTERCLQQIAERNPSINAFITVLADQALAQAREADRELAAGRDRGPLHGVPISLKDLIDLRGVPTTAASRVRDGHVAAADAPVVRRLREAGAVFVGKTNLHEFALGTTNEDSAFGPVRHPLDPSRSPGGSSGGSAASVLAGMAFASIGTDTGGSIRIPSAACGLVGLKPALGEIPTDGVVPLSATMDHVGPLCRSVEDAAIVYDVLRGARLNVRVQATPADLQGYASACCAATSRRCSTRRWRRRSRPRAGVCATRASCSRTSRSRTRSDIAPIYLHIVLAEAAAYHAKTLESRADDYTPNVRLRLEMGRYILAEDYVRALRGRDLLRRGGRCGARRPRCAAAAALAVPATKLGAATVRVGGAKNRCATSRCA